MWGHVKVGSEDYGNTGNSHITCRVEEREGKIQVSTELYTFAFHPSNSDPKLPTTKAPRTPRVIQEIRTQGCGS
jgi:hypothetical protein